MRFTCFSRVFRFDALCVVVGGVGVGRCRGWVIEYIRDREGIRVFSRFRF